MKGSPKLFHNREKWINFENESQFDTSLINSHAVGMAVAWPNGLKFFVIILKFIFTFIFQIKIFERKFRDIKKSSLSKADFH